MIKETLSDKRYHIHKNSTVSDGWIYIQDDVKQALKEFEKRLIGLAHQQIENKIEKVKIDHIGVELLLREIFGEELLK